jgi:HK97 gp10 family phage protein
MAKGVELFGSKELQRTFNTLGERVQRSVLRSAVSVASTPISRAAKANAPRESGLLKKSLGKKVVTNKEKQSVSAIIGPRRNVSGMHKGKLRKPSRYAHLVEKGFIDAAGRFHPPQAFLQPAYDQTQAQVLGVMRDKLATGVAKEAARGNK